MRELGVDLDRPPDDRWEGLAPWRAAARELLAFYIRDLGGGLATFAPLLLEYRDRHVDPEYSAEMHGVARVLDVSEQDVVLANLYYDAIKLVLSSPMGCTAFAIDTPGPLHARNLDWTSADGRLASETLVVNFRRGRGEPIYRTIGWPGFVGCLSGVARGRFAVTLNAVLSDDPPTLASPVSFVLRRALECAASFDDAVVSLRDTPLPCDGLLLVTGTRAWEMAVIERAPTRGAVRGASGGSVLVTNDYRALAASPDATTLHGDLAKTSCGRYDRAQALIRETPPQTADACLAVLRDPEVKMGITVQHMVLSATLGTIALEQPA